MKLSGKAVPGQIVEIYARAAGSSAAFGWIDTVTADASGDWVTVEWISGSTTFIAKGLGTYASTSSPITVKVDGVPTPTIKSYSAKALGKGKVTLTVAGNGNANSRVTIYQIVGKKFVKVAYVKVNSKGVASATIKTSKGSKAYKFVYANGSKTATKVISVKVK